MLQGRQNEDGTSQGTIRERFLQLLHMKTRFGAVLDESECSIPICKADEKTNLERVGTTFASDSAALVYGFYAPVRSGWTCGEIPYARTKSGAAPNEIPYARATDFGQRGAQLDPGR